MNHFQQTTRSPSHDWQTPPDEGPMIIMKECVECVRVGEYDEDEGCCKFCGGELQTVKG